MKNLSQHFILTLVSISVPAVSFAFFCPTNFSQIDFGMTTDQVTTICGKPDMQQDSKKDDDNVPQEWNYYIPQTVSMGGSNGQNATGTLKTSVAFDDKGNAINISVNGIGVGSTTICGSNIQLGSNRDAIKAACGTPSFVTKETPTGAVAAQSDIKITEFIYSKATPPVTLIFENGKLTDKK